MQFWISLLSTLILKRLFSQQSNLSAKSIQQASGDLRRYSAIEIGLINRFQAL